MTVKTNTGTIVSIVEGEPVTHDVAGFQALTFQLIGEVVDFPSYGGVSAVVEHLPLATGIVEKLKGFINYGSVSMGLGYDISDLGQALLKEANDGTAQFAEMSFSIEYSDGEIDYFTGKIFSYDKSAGTANSIVSSTALVEINTTVVTYTP